MPGLYALVATRTDGETLTAAKYNGDHQNHIDNQELQKTDDFSATVGQMQTTTDPGEAGTESLATDATGELARLRFAIKETKDALGTTVAQWYSTPGTISGLISTQGINNNLCPNSDVEDWRNGTSVAPFLYTLSGAGASVARDGTNFKTGTFAASVTRSGTDAILDVDCIARAGGQAHIRSRAYRFSAWVRATVANRVRLRINDGVGSTFSSYHSGGGTFERLSVPRTLDAAATALNVGLSVDTGDTVGQIDTLMLSEGTAEVAWSLRGETSVFRQVFTAGGTYTKPSNLLAARVIVQAAGGGGGRVPTVGVDGRGNSAGGGSGSYAESVFPAPDIGATETVTVGTGGVGTTTPGGTGGGSSFGTLVTANGGVGGGGTANANSSTTGGLGGAAGTGQITIPGGRGGDGVNTDENGLGVGGAGAPSTIGAGGGQRTKFGSTLAAGIAGVRGGGGSGCATGATGTQDGGAGGDGIVIVQETVVI